MSLPNHALSTDNEALSPSTDEGKHPGPIVDPASGQARETLMPSEVARPTRSDSEPQQASTQPGDGSKCTHEESYHPEATDSQRQGKVPWKDQVLGYAKVTRGKVLRKQATQEEGHKILQGEIIPEETRKRTES